MIGEVLARRYRILRLVSEGGMGSVHEAERVDTGERVAVKLIRQGRLSGAAAAEAASRFRREARAAAAAGGENIVQILEEGIDDRTGDLFIVMELLEGEDLHQMIQRSGPLPPDLALRIVGQALLGLRRAHESGVVHRDVKPGNLFLARRGGGDVMVKLLDFGIAKVRGGGGLDPLHTTGLTASGNFLGSPLYMSPEQVKSSKHVDHRTDLWSIGCVLYCALAGRPPHKHAPSVGELILAICHAPAHPVHNVAPWVSPEVSALVQRALAIEPRRRYASASEMLDALRRLAPDLTLREEMWADLPVLQALPPLSEDGAHDTGRSASPENETVRVGAPAVADELLTAPPASLPGLVDTPSSARSREDPTGASIARRRARRLRWSAVVAASLAAAGLGALKLGLPGEASITAGAGPPPLPAALPAPSGLLPVPATPPGAVLSLPDAARPSEPAPAPAPASAASTTSAAEAKARAHVARRTSPAPEGGAAPRAPEPGTGQPVPGQKPAAAPRPLEDEPLHEHR